VVAGAQRLRRWLGGGQEDLIAFCALFSGPFYTLTRLGCNFLFSRGLSVIVY
jgi:hypothetical protein